MEKPAIAMSLVAARSNPRNVMKLYRILEYPGKGPYKLINRFGDLANNGEASYFLPTEDAKGDAAEYRLFLPSCRYSRFLYE